MQTNSAGLSWRLQDAKAQFSAVVEGALRGVPQHVTRRGKQAVVVLSEQDFIALQSPRASQVPSFIDHLRAMPTEPGGQRGADNSSKKRKPAPAATRAKLVLHDLEL